MVIGYHEILDFVQQMLPDMRVTRQRNLTWLVLGILRIRDAHLTVSEIARAILTRSDHWYKFKRMWRFLSNTKWSPTECFRDVLGFVLDRFHAGTYLPVIIDQSTLAGKWEILWASIPFRGRAVPIYFTLFRKTDFSDQDENSQNLLEERFVRAVVSLFPDPQRLLLLFDRGYARVPLIQLLDALRVFYVIRVRGGTWVQFRSKYQGLLQNIPIRRGQLIWWRDALYQQQEQYPVNLAISLNETAEEPWYLVTNLRRAATTVNWYARRFRCEELFRDIKDQLHLETIRLKGSERIERLLFGLVVAYLALTLIGVAAHRAGLRKKVCKDRISPAWMALRLLHMPQFLKPRLVRKALLAYSWSLYYESG